ncbi:unnamed protein product [Pleuronectes platessa]|uniref:Uncharacterized protein n=1 Tax=Pleuronectes platessa TaxID=8262 RepID=A0A9N7VCW9_PLEPL|nr:unnamed protein product [Pleuronectes platessa]
MGWTEGWVGRAVGSLQPPVPLGLFDKEQSTPPPKVFSPCTRGRIGRRPGTTSTPEEEQVLGPSPLHLPTPSSIHPCPPHSPLSFPSDTQWAIPTRPITRSATSAHTDTELKSTGSVRFQDGRAPVMEGKSERSLRRSGRGPGTKLQKNPIVTYLRIMNSALTY